MGQFTGQVRMPSTSSISSSSSIGISGLPVKFVDKGKNRNVAHDADLKQLDGLRLHALGAVDHHDRGVRRHQGTVGILREVLVSRRIQDIDAVSVIVKLHGGGGNGNTSLLLDLHPVGHRVLCRLAALYRSRQVDGASVQQELLRQRGLTCIGVGNDGKGSALFYLFYHLII